MTVYVSPLLYTNRSYAILPFLPLYLFHSKPVLARTHSQGLGRVGSFSLLSGSAVLMAVHASYAIPAKVQPWRPSCLTPVTDKAYSMGVGLTCVAWKQAYGGSPSCLRCCMLWDWKESNTCYMPRQWLRCLLAAVHLPASCL